MTDSPPATATVGPPPSVDIQDPVPESNFFYRRIFSYFLSVVLLALLLLAVWRIEESAELRRVASYLCMLLFTVITYYMIAPSAEQVVKMLQTAKLFTAGVTTHATATAESAAGSATSTTTTGMAVDPEVDAAPRGRP